MIADTPANLTHTTVEVIKVSFELIDNRNRLVGSRLSIRQRTATRREGGNGYLIPEAELGTTYGYDLHAQRDGADFGACNSTKWFPTREEATTKGQQAMEVSRKRYARQFADKTPSGKGGA